MFKKLKKQIVRGQKKLSSFSAEVVHGRGRGFYTANLDATNLELPHGVYLVDVLWKGKKYKGLMHFGYRPTFHDSISAEVHLKDFDEYLYGQKVTVHVHKKIRDIVEFSSEKALKAQIDKDMECIK